MDSDPTTQNVHDVIPTSCRDMLALAEKALERYWADPTVLNLYPMALLTSHIADWYVTRDLGLPKYRFASEFAQAYPVWDAIRGVGNGLKHAKAEAFSPGQFFTGDMHFEHRNWWGGDAYGAPFDGKLVPVDALCFAFIQEFSGDLMTGRVRDRLPTLHASQSARENA